MQQGKGKPRGKARLYMLTVVAAMLMSLVLSVPVATATTERSTPIEVFQSFSSFSAATRITQTISFDEFATGAELGNPTTLGPVTFQHSSALTFKTATSPPYTPVSPPNVLAPYKDDGTLAFGDTTVGLGKNIRAAGLFLVLLQGSNQDAIWTSTVTATDTENQSVTATVTFRGTFGEQQFIGFKSRAKLVSVFFGPALRLDTGGVVAMDNVVVG